VFTWFGTITLRALGPYLSLNCERSLQGQEGIDPQPLGLARLDCSSHAKVLIKDQNNGCKTSALSARNRARNTLPVLKLGTHYRPDGSAHTVGPLDLNLSELRSEQESRTPRISDSELGSRNKGIRTRGAQLVSTDCQVHCCNTSCQPEMPESGKRLNTGV
jgi:hypothetical protein